ncbi:cobalt-precorrin 5A hydrolase [Methanosphaera sp. ISO3-F5]|uniref:cobalt-precorrin 5A hydrolase n=1 Tax=Methanosphaera sp. ISO3-F5 TaxID=1452353 RepID=UPI002B258A4D|nr:cobalt-precorrin 5A hydrolase [Methanosphaera sp. ISO3-F5]WQH64895.1 cobalt-precorrin 5A hydrolase [Methanosphaera sp. ISO3-F5]
MNIAILSVTNQGKEISDKLYDNLIQNPLFLNVKQYHKNIINTVNEIFDKYDCIIGIMASGIMIRSIAPHVNSKLSDPAVLLIDDNANFTISLLSGHFGGANDLTLKIAEILGSTPVITTSTDVNNKVGIDSIAKRFYCTLENPKNIKFINKALVNNTQVELCLHPKYSYILTDEVKKSYNTKISEEYQNITATVDNHKVILKPKQLVMGIGARKDISYDKVKNAIISACNILEFSPLRIDFFATADVKANEKGILENIKELNKELKIIPMDEIKAYQNEECSESDFVMKQFGVKGVCEPSALIANGTGSHLIFKKTAYNGVTIAVSLSD